MDAKKRKNVFVIVIVLITIIVVGIAIFMVMRNEDGKTQVNDTNNIELKSEYRMSGNSLQDFDLAFLKLENAKENKVYSPISIKYTLEMLSEGSKGDTKNELDAIIGDYVSKRYVNSANMAFANALFIRDSYKNAISNDYKNLLSNKYDASIIFDSFATPDNINSWINNKTLGLINNMFDDNIPYDFIITNALGIDMDWKNWIQPEEILCVYVLEVNYLHEAFSAYIAGIDVDGYSKLEFAGLDNPVLAVEVGAVLNNYDIVSDLGRNYIKELITDEYKEYLDNINQNATDKEIDDFVENFIEELDSNYKSVATSTDFKLYVDDEVKVFTKELKEYNGTTLEYVGIMPESESLDKFIESKSANDIEKIASKAKDIKLENFASGKITYITGYIPLFSFDYSLNLKEDLMKMGVNSVFESGKADLSNMTSVEEAYIEDAGHKANISFSNEGIKAAAATMVGGAGDAWGGFEHLFDVPVETIDITFDKPFMFLIRDVETHEVWFTGTVYEPTEFSEEMNMFFAE